MKVEALPVVERDVHHKRESGANLRGFLLFVSDPLVLQGLFAIDEGIGVHIASRCFRRVWL